MKIANLEKLQASSATSMTLIFIGAFLTGLGVYDLIGKRAGAGSIIPITGFANSIVSPAMEFKKEGYVMGVGANLFKIATMASASLQSSKVVSSAGTTSFCEAS